MAAIEFFASDPLSVSRVEESHDAYVLTQTPVTLRPYPAGSAESLAASRLRAQLARTADPCGCKSGAAFLLIVLVGWPIWMWLSTSVRTAADVVAGVVGYPAVIVAAGAVGKVAGIVVSRWHNARLRRRLAAS